METLLARLTVRGQDRQCGHNYFQGQKKLSPKQARWQDFLAEFDMVMEYKPGRTNQVVDALSCKAELASLRLEWLASIDQLQGTLLTRIKEGLEHDAMAKGLMEMARKERQRDFGCKTTFSTPSESGSTCQSGGT